MIYHVPSLEKLTHELNKMPGIGPKTAQRLAYYLMRSSEDYISSLRSALLSVKENVHECPECFSYTEEEDLCHFCQESGRDQGVLCVVEDPADISRVESSGVFKGLYHVLHGAISPLEGIHPQDLKIAPLLKKVQDGREGKRTPLREIILALDADLEGDTTVLYLAKALQDKGLQISRIAHGVPIGGDIDYIDFRTLGRALENRVVL